MAEALLPIVFALDRRREPSPKRLPRLVGASLRKLGRGPTEPA